jgi:hypothetical protein
VRACTVGRVQTCLDGTEGDALLGARKGASLGARRGHTFGRRGEYAVGYTVPLGAQTMSLDEDMPLGDDGRFLGALM